MGGLPTKFWSKKLSFLSTDSEETDTTENNINCTPKYRVVTNSLLDPRSATLEIKRTPLVLLIPKDDLEDDSNINCSTPVRRYLETDIDDFVPLQSVENENEVDLSEHSEVPTEPASSSDTSLEEDKPVRNHLELLDQVKEILVEPLEEQKLQILCENVKVAVQISTPPSTPVRRPLGPVNALFPSPVNKSWKGPYEERAKLGLADLENTPPHFIQPPPETVQSAPNPRRVRALSRAHWDHQLPQII